MNFSACTTRIAFSLATTLISLSAAAQVSVSNPWVRATVPDVYKRQAIRSI